MLFWEWPLSKQYLSTALNLCLITWNWLPHSHAVGGRFSKFYDSSWKSKGVGQKEGEDYLSNLGQAQDYNINIDHGKQPIDADIMLSVLELY